MLVKSRLKTYSLLSNFFTLVVLLVVSSLPLSAAGLLCESMLAQLEKSGGLHAFLNCPPAGCDPLLHQAIQSKDWDSVDLLLKWGADPAALNSQKQSARQVADIQGSGARLHDLHLKHTSDAGIPLAHVRRDLRLANIKEDYLDVFINNSPEKWPSGFAVRDGHSELVERAVDKQLPELTQYLVESKGLKLKLPAIIDQQNYADEKQSEFNFGVWSMAMASKDPAKYFKFLREQNFPLREVYESRMSFRTSPLSLFVHDPGRYIGDVQRYAPLPLDVEVFKYFLDAGVDPARDDVVMSALLNNPEEHAAVWKILQTHEYPAKSTFKDWAPLSFVQMLREENYGTEVMTLAREQLRKMGLETFGSGKDPVLPLFAVRSKKMAEYLIEREKLDPLAEGNPGGFWELPPANGKVDAATYHAVELEHNGPTYAGIFEHNELEAYRRLAIRLRTERLATFQSDFEAFLQPFHANLVPIIRRQFELTDYLIRVTLERRKPKPFILGESSLDGPDVLQ
jgi:hypothetical protein